MASFVSVQGETSMRSGGQSLRAQQQLQQQFQQQQLARFEHKLQLQELSRQQLQVCQPQQQDRGMAMQQTQQPIQTHTIWRGVMEVGTVSEYIVTKFHSKVMIPVT